MSCSPKFLCRVSLLCQCFTKINKSVHHSECKTDQFERGTKQNEIYSFCAQWSGWSHASIGCRVLELEAQVVILSQAFVDGRILW